MLRNTRLENLHRLTNLPKSLIEIAPEAKDISRDIEERSKIALATERMGQLTGVAAKDQSIIKPAAEHMLVSHI